MSKRTENVSWIQIFIAALFTGEKGINNSHIHQLIHKQSVYNNRMDNPDIKRIKYLKRC